MKGHWFTGYMTEDWQVPVIHHLHPASWGIQLERPFSPPRCGAKV